MKRFRFTVKGHDGFQYSATIEAVDFKEAVDAIIRKTMNNLSTMTHEKLRITSVEERS